MRISNKIHRSTSILAGIFTLLSLLIYLLATLVNAISGMFLPTSILPTLREILVMVLLIIVMFRGKKDPAAGVMALIMLLAATAYDVITYGMQLLRSEYFLEYFNSLWLVSRVLALVSAVVYAVFYLLIALECFNPGKISGTGMKALLVVLPVVGVLLFVTNKVLFTCSSGMPLGLALVSGGLLDLLKGIGPIVAGIATSIAVEEEVVYSEYPQYPQYPQQF